MGGDKEDAGGGTEDWSIVRHCFSQARGGSTRCNALVAVRRHQAYILRFLGLGATATAAKSTTARTAASGWTPNLDCSVGCLINDSAPAAVNPRTRTESDLTGTPTMNASSWVSKASSAAGRSLTRVCDPIFHRARISRRLKSVAEASVVLDQAGGIPRWLDFHA